MTEHDAQGRTEDEGRQIMRDQHGCNCDCTRICIKNAGGDPGNPDCIVFNHTFECHYTRIWNASNN